MLTIGQDLLMGEEDGYLQILDMSSCKITHTHRFDLGIYAFYDIAAIDDTQYLLASDNGLLKTTKDHLLKHNFKWSTVISICALQDPQIYLLGFSSPE